MYHPIKVKSLGKYRIWVQYEDGSSGEIDLSALSVKPVFQFWDVGNNFDKVYINNESGAIAWNEDIDICPDNVYYEINGINPEQVLLKKTG